MGKLDELYDRIYQLKVWKEGLDRFRTTERGEYDQRIEVLKKQIMVLKNPPPEKRIIIDEILKLRSDLSIIYTDPLVELGSFTLTQLQHHLERCKKGYRFFTAEQVLRIKTDRNQKLGNQKVCPPSIKDLILKMLKEKDCTLAELVTSIQGNPQTIKATLTYHLKKQGYNIEVVKEGVVEKYKLNGYIDTGISETIEEELKPEEIKDNTTMVVLAVKPKVAYPKEGVFNFIVNRLKEKSYTIGELAELTGASPSTIKQNILYTARNKGVTITPVAEAGYSELKYIINSPTTGA